MKREKLKIFASAIAWGIIIDIVIELSKMFTPTESVVAAGCDFWVLPLVLAVCFASLAAIWWNEK